MNDPDEFIYTRGPHEGGPMVPDHRCMPGCYGPTMVVATGWSTRRQRPGAHAHVELAVEVHPDVDLQEVKLRLIRTVMELNAELRERRTT